MRLEWMISWGKGGSGRGPLMDLELEKECLISLELENNLFEFDFNTLLVKLWIDVNYAINFKSCLYYQCLSYYLKSYNSR